MFRQLVGYVSSMYDGPGTDTNPFQATSAHEKNAPAFQSMTTSSDGLKAITSTSNILNLMIDNTKDPLNIRISIQNQRCLADTVTHMAEYEKTLSLAKQLLPHPQEVRLLGANDVNSYVRTNFKLTTPTELACLLNEIRKKQQAGGFCKDGKENCFLNDADARKMMKDYRQFYNEISITDSTLSFETVQNEIVRKQRRELVINAGNAMTHAFIETLSQYYLRPFLITNKYEFIPDELIISLSYHLNIICTFFLTTSLSTALIEFVTNYIGRMLIDHVLANNEVSRYAANALVSYFNSLYLFLKSPFFSMEGGAITLSTYAGRMAAFKLIQHLPKIKQEPKPRVIFIDQAMMFGNQPTPFSSPNTHLKYRRRK